MDVWRLEGTGLDLDSVGPELVIEADDGGVVIFGELEALKRIMRMPGFRLHLLQLEPGPTPRATAVLQMADPHALVLALMDAQRANRLVSRLREEEEARKEANRIVDGFTPHQVGYG